MTAIRPIDNDLNSLIKRDLYRSTLNDINQDYENMETFISNLKSDISAIEDLVSTLERQKATGYDIGTSMDTLLFQKSTLKIDLDFYVHMKKVYMNKLYQDLYSYTGGIIDSAVSIEQNPTDRTVEDIKAGKFSGCKPYEVNAEYTMSEIFILLSTTERNLFELSTDIASFESLISEAKGKESRGFAIGNLLINLQAQQTKLQLEFKSYCTRLEQFLLQNKGFAKKCLKRIALISGEIVTSEELAEKEAEEEESGDEEESDEEEEEDNEA